MKVPETACVEDGKCIYGARMDNATKEMKVMK